MKAQELPVIDFGAFPSGREEDRCNIANQIKQACEDWGFFYLRNYGIPKTLVDRLFESSHAFFDLPLKDKEMLAWKSASSNRGYVGMSRERLDPSNEDLKEAFNAGPEPESGEFLVHEKCYRQNLWPDSLPGFKKLNMEFIGQCTFLSNLILEAMAQSLDLPMKFFVDFHERNHHTLRLLHYPQTLHDSSLKEKKYRAGEHADYGSITLLFQDNVSGLEVRSRDGSWISAVPIPDTVVVNTGDLMEHWTNKRFCSTQHRVISTMGAEGAERYSIAFFCHPNLDAEIQCVSTCTSVSNPPLYPPITAGAYLMEKLEATY